MDFITAVSFGLICFRIGYTFGKDNNKSQNNRSTVRFSLSGKHTLFSLSQLEVEIYPVSYTHLTLPTKRIV